MGYEQLWWQQPFRLDIRLTQHWLTGARGPPLSQREDRRKHIFSWQKIIDLERDHDRPHKCTNQVLRQKVWAGRDFFFPLGTVCYHECLCFHIGQLPIPRAGSGIDVDSTYCVTEFVLVHFPTCQVVKNKSQQQGRGRETAKTSEWGKGDGGGSSHWGHSWKYFPSLLP